MKIARILAVLCLLCLVFAGCDQGSTATLPAHPLPSQNQNPILPSQSSTNTEGWTLTTVSVTVFDDTAILARQPVLTWGEEEMIGEPRDISQGGTIGCKDEEGNTVRITKVVIAEDIVPRSTRDWFRDLTYLGVIQGAELLHTDFVTDMSHMFSGCTSLSSIQADGWNTAKVTNMIGIFDGCTAMANKPKWYQES